MSLLQELKRRRVFRVAFAYIVAAWVIIQVADVLTGILALPGWAPRLVVMLLVAGFVPAVLIAWAYQRTPEGLQREPVETTVAESPHRRTNAVEHVALGLLATALIGIAIVWYLGREERWARTAAMPRLDTLIEAGDFEAAYTLATTLEGVIPEDDELAENWRRFTRIATIPSDPPSAMVYRKAYDAPDDAWVALGRTPIHDVPIPVGLSLLRIELEGYRPLLRGIGNGFRVPTELSVADRSQGTLWGVRPERFILDPPEILPDSMVRVPGTQVLVDGAMVEVADFFLSRFEVTNREFKEFVDAGAYDRPELWREPFRHEGKEIDWSEARALMVDRSGRPGPANWQAGSFPDGLGDHPVTGISWYEAAAYADFLNRDLPTAWHWRRALATGFLAWLLPASNLDNDATAPVGEFRGIGWTGTYDMAGNAREWTYNEIEGRRVILGGGFDDPLYVVQESVQDLSAVPPFDRSAANGFRLAILRDDDQVTAALHAEIERAPEIEIPEPMSDEAYATLTTNFDYDSSPLNPVIDNVIDKRHWTIEVVSIDAGYDDERMTVYLYLPKSSAPPYQTITLWPGIGALFTDEVNHDKIHLEFALRNGRAVAVPVLTGTWQRRLAALPPKGSLAERNLVFQQVRDFRRAVDYLQTRQDIRRDSLAFYGFSWGGRLGPLVLAVEPRLKVGVLNQAGIEPGVHFDINTIHYAPRVTVPLLQFNGRYDADFRYEEQARPLFDSLGTESANKRWVVADTGHFVPQQIYIGETLDWIDQYLGAVSLVSQVRSTSDVK